MKILPNRESLPPHRDKDLSDRKGEIWQDIPGMDGCYLVSNFGRIKRLEREIFDSQGGAYILASRIIIPSINFSHNIIIGDQTHRLQVTLQVSNKKRSFMVHRLVYHCFVQQFAMDDLSLNVVPKNGNGFDINPKNLLLLPVKARCKRTFKKGRLLSPLDLNPENISRAVEASVAVTSREVSQYNEKGKWMATYCSMMDACRKTGISHSCLTSAIHRTVSSKAGGYFWRFGHKRKLNLAEIEKALKHKKHSYMTKRGKSVQQYDLKGNLLSSFDAISLAAKSTGISHKSITNHLNGHTSQGGGFIWSWAKD